MLNNTHQLVMTDAITNEWNEHQSGFARRWRFEMTSRRRVLNVSVHAASTVRARVESTAASLKDREAISKDCLLIEAALEADRIVLSLDETVRVLFARATLKVVEMRDIVWVNPTIEDEQCDAWLTAGAKFERQRMLRHHGSAQSTQSNTP